MMVGLSWLWQFNSILTNYQQDLKQNRTKHFQTLINITAQNLQTQFNETASLLPLYLTEHTLDIQERLEAQFINQDILAIYQIHPNRLNTIYTADPNQEQIWPRFYQANTPAQMSCLQNQCYLFFTLQTYGAQGTPLNLFIVQQVNFWLQSLHQLLNPQKQWLLLIQQKHTPQLKLSTFKKDQHPAWHLLTPYLQKNQAQLIQLSEHYQLILPLQLPFPQDEQLQLWLLEDVHQELANWQTFIQHSSLQFILLWGIIIAALFLFIRHKLNTISQLDTALELAAQQQLTQATQHLKFPTPPKLIDELHLLLLNARKMLLKVARANQQLEWMAYHDTLTKLPNRRSFYQDLKTIVHHKQGAILFLDLNGFKQINDVFGHEMGDTVLKDMAYRLKTLKLPIPFKAYRLAGDEFTLIFSAPLTNKLTQSLLADISQHLNGTVLTATQETIYYHASIGAVLLDKNTADSANKLLHWADIAMYKAKHENHSQRWHIFNPLKDDDTLAHKQELKLVHWIQNHLDTHCYLVIQPIAPLHQTQKTHHYEVLLRLKDPDGKPISPADFIPIAERHGLIQKIDLWVLKNALIALQKLPPEVCFSINLSAPSLQHPNMGKTITQALEKHQVSPKRLTIELTETAYIANMKQVKTNLAQLKQIGISLSLDDFGVGFTSFSYLNELDFDYIKIDGSYIKDLLTNPHHQAFVEGITQIIHASHKKVIAEFVENEAIINKLKQYQVDHIQGWHLGKPLPIQDYFNLKKNSEKA